MRTMAQFIQQRRYPAEIMALTADEDAKRGPYHPCPCGSGVKFRFCHGNGSPSTPFSGVANATATASDGTRGATR
jgi:uncharacterized protein